MFFCDFYHIFVRKNKIFLIILHFFKKAPIFIYTIIQKNVTVKLNFFNN